MCGKAKKPDGSPLLTCSGCGDRLYCGKVCQKKHWKYHKILCTYPKDRMESFLDSIPLDFAADIASRDTPSQQMNWRD